MYFFLFINLFIWLTNKLQVQNVRIFIQNVQRLTKIISRTFGCVSDSERFQRTCQCANFISTHRKPPENQCTDSFGCVCICSKNIFPVCWIKNENQNPGVSTLVCWLSTTGNCNVLTSNQTFLMSARCHCHFSLCRRSDSSENHTHFCYTFMSVTACSRLFYAENNYLSAITS